MADLPEISKGAIQTPVAKPDKPPENDLVDKIRAQEPRKVLEELRGLEAKKHFDSVERISRENNAIFVHGIRPDIKGGQNNYVLHPSTKWENKVDIALTERPIELSTSTIQAGDGPGRMWSRMGLILSGGAVTFARPVDAGTVVYSRGSRPTHNRLSPPLEESINKTMARMKNRTDPYEMNELIVSNPEFAGFYISRDPLPFGESPDRDDTGRDQDIIELAQEIGMPIFIVKNGRVYRSTKAELDYDNEQYDFGINEGAPLSIEEILDSKVTISEAQRKKMVERSNERYIA